MISNLFNMDFIQERIEREWSRECFSSLIDSAIYSATSANVYVCVGTYMSCTASEVQWTRPNRRLAYSPSK